VGGNERSFPFRQAKAEKPCTGTAKRYEPLLAEASELARGLGVNRCRRGRWAAVHFPFVIMVERGPDAGNRMITKG
jgi:hypothetical protein